MLKKFLCSALLLLLLCVPACANAPAPVLTTTHRIEQKTFLGLSHSTCSATAVGPHALLTASHCEVPTDDLLLDGNKAVIRARIRDNYDHTIYIVDAVFPQYAKLHDFKTSEPRPGDDIWVRGNPAGMPMLVRHGTYAGTVTRMSMEGLSLTLQSTHWFDYNGYFGDSGAAVFDNEGDIVDVISIINSVRKNDDAPPFVLMGGFGLHFSADQLKQAAQ